MSYCIKDMLLSDDSESFILLKAIGGRSVAPLAITEYTTSPDTEAAHTFSYPTEQLATCWDGAKLRITPPADGTAPFTWGSSDNTIAEVDDNGTVTLHNSGEFTITVTDSRGAVGIFTLTPPAFFTLPDGVGRTYDEAAAYCAELGGIFPSDGELTKGKDVRGIGTLWSEWGDLGLAGWPSVSGNLRSSHRGTSGNSYHVHYSDGDAVDSSDATPEDVTCMFNSQADVMAFIRLKRKKRQE